MTSRLTASLWRSTRVVAPLAVVIVVASVVGGSFAGSPSAGAAAAWTPGACQTAQGVTVVVDFQELGGGVAVRCTSGGVSNGIEALQSAGIGVETARNSSGFVCRLAGKPGNDPCINTSPASAYWSYWIAPRGGTWCYSNLGAGSRTPPAGAVEGWSFSLNRSRSTSPPPRVAVPGRLTGAPTTLSGAGCDRSAGAPTATVPAAPAPTTTPAATTPPAAPGPATAVPPGVAPSAAEAPGAAPDALAPSPPAVNPAPGAPTTAPVAPTTVTTATGPASTTTDVPGEDDGDDGGDEADDGTVTGEDASSRDLSGDDGGGGSAVGLVIALLIIAALGAGTIAFRRRAAKA